MSFSRRFPGVFSTYPTKRELRVSFQDGEILEGTILGYTSAPDNDSEFESVELQVTQYPGCVVSVYENEIKSCLLVDLREEEL